MPRLHLAVLTTRNETSFPGFKITTSCLQYDSSFLFTLQTKYYASLTTKKQFFKSFALYLVVKPVCINTAQLVNWKERNVEVKLLCSRLALL